MNYLPAFRRYGIVCEIPEWTSMGIPKIVDQLCSSSRVQYLSADLAEMPFLVQIRWVRVVVMFVISVALKCED